MLVKVKSETGGPIVVPATGMPGQENLSVATSHVLLVDGWNEIPEALWPYTEANMESGVEAGVFEYKCKVVEDKRQIMPLQEVRADQARDIVKGCFNPQVLDRWLNNTKLSSELRALVDIQIANIAKVEAIQ